MFITGECKERSLSTVCKAAELSDWEQTRTWEVSAVGALGDCRVTVPLTMTGWQFRGTSLQWPHQLARQSIEPIVPILG